MSRVPATSLVLPVEAPTAHAMEVETLESSLEAPKKILTQQEQQPQESNPIVSSDEASPVATTKVRPARAEEDEDEEKMEDQEQANDTHQTNEETTQPTSLHNVWDALESLDSEGCACTGGLATELPFLPGLVVERVGQVPVPMDPDTATKLKTRQQQEPQQSVWDKSNRMLQTVGDILVPKGDQEDSEYLAVALFKWMPTRSPRPIQPGVLV